MSPEHLNLTPAPVEMATARFGSQPAHFRTVPASLEMVPAIRHLATGATLCVKDFVPLTQMTQDGVCRHIGVLLQAGIMEPVPPPDGDRRKSCYRIVPQFLVVRNGLVELDCGAGVVRLNLPAKMAEA